MKILLCYLLKMFADSIQNRKWQKFRGRENKGEYSMEIFEGSVANFIRNF